MSDPFLICGLPRSRTAWLANFLNYGDVECSHELVHELSVSGMHRFITRSSQKYAGNSDTMQSLLMPDILRLMNPPIVVVQRDPIAVAASLTALGLHTSLQLMQMLQMGLEYVKGLPRCLTVRFEDLSNPETGEAILKHVAPCEPFNRWRFTQLCGWNVQVTKGKLMKILEKVKEDF